MTDEQRSSLEAMARSPSLPHRQVRQARALVLAADGVANAAIAREVGVTANSVRAWRDRFEAAGVDGVGKVAPGRGRKPTITPAQVEAIVADTLHTTPDDATHWSTRTLAAKHSVSHMTVAKIWRERRLRPWRVDAFKLSNDPEFEAQLVDVAGLYLDPPERAVVLCFDSKSQIQALQRTQPGLAIKPGRGATMTHDYRRHGTTTLFAALDVATGQVINHCFPRHRAKEFLAFLKIIDGQVPRGLTIHLVLDNYATHRHQTVRAWLDKPRQRDRWQLHFTPTSSSWTNLVERWFGLLTNRQLRRSSFDSVHDLIDTIDEWADTWSTSPRPFSWTADPADIIAKVERARQALIHQTESFTEH